MKGDGQLSLFDDAPLFDRRLPDPSDPYAVFIKDGKPWYISQCPKYEGYWLDGGRGAVQCSGEILPGRQWYAVCSKCPETCPFYRKECTP